MRYAGRPDLVGGRVGVAEAVLDVQPVRWLRPVWKVDLDRPCPELRVSLFSAARGREVSTERDVWKHLDYSEPRVSNKSAPEHYVCVAEAAQASVVRH